MMGTDRYAYASRLKTIAPAAKITMSAVSVVLCLSAQSMPVCMLAILTFCVLLVRAGGTPLPAVCRLMAAPFWFLLVGAAPIVLTRCSDLGAALWGVTLGGRVYGVTAASLANGARLIVRALGVIASVYFTALTTPVTDLLPALRRMHVPRLFVALMELIYRFIFVLFETAGRIRTAQASRLGYDGLRRSFQSLGVLLSAVFMSAYRRADRIFTALESRGYEGEINMLARPYESGKTVYLWCAGLTAAQLALLAAERGLLC